MPGWHDEPAAMYAVLMTFAIKTRHMTSSPPIALGMAGGLVSNPVPANDRQRFRSLIGTFATGVTVVTTSNADGPAGMTASAVAALSVEPLLVMVGVDLTSRTLATVRQSRRFAINVLASDQEHVSRVFASKDAEAEKFAACAHANRAAVPILDGTLAWLRCDVVADYPGGDHVILVGNVVEMGGGGGDPLLFFAGRYRTLDRAAAPQQQRGRRASSAAELDGAQPGVAPRQVG